MLAVVADLIEPILSAGKTVKEKEKYLMVKDLNFCYLLINFELRIEIALADEKH